MRSRPIWILVGDKNTKFFHKRAIQRRCNNQIDELVNENGVRRTDMESIANSFGG